MNKQKWILIGAVSGLVISFAVAASSSPLNTPLYIFRMEQASSEMNFLPTEMNKFVYAAENGCNLNVEIDGYWIAEEVRHDTNPRNTCRITCIPTCPPYTEGGDTCNPTSCQPTCRTCYTCNPTCNNPWTCYLSTCAPTCNPTCNNPWTCYLSTCAKTCGFTCGDVYTCEDTCRYTCETCEPTCKIMCEPRDY
jgi:hypothetical protein